MHLYDLAPSLEMRRNNLCENMVDLKLHKEIILKIEELNA